MDVVYPKFDAVVQMPDGSQVSVRMGTHWVASDPVVKARPEVFTADGRYGAQFYGAPPEEMTVPPDGYVEAATAAPGEKRNVRQRG